MVTSDQKRPPVRREDPRQGREEGAYGRLARRQLLHGNPGSGSGLSSNQVINILRGKVEKTLFTFFNLLPCWSRGFIA